MRSLVVLLLLWMPASAGAQAATLHGRVVDEQGIGIDRAAVSVDSLGRGTLTDSAGRFLLPELPAGRHTVRASMMGFRSVTAVVSIQEDVGEPLTLRLPADPLQLEPIEVEGEKARSGIDVSETVRTEVIIHRDLVDRADRGTLMSALDGQIGLKTRPCAMCGSCGVGMQGLEPSYTEVNVDGLPVYTGLGTLYGLDGVSAADVERLEIVKGTGSSLYGSGAIAGAVNLVSVPPDREGSFEARVSSDQYGQSSLHIGGSGISERAPMRLSFSAGATPDRIDTNDDGVTDVPESWRSTLNSSIEIPVRASRLRLGGRAYWENRFAGELDWSTADRGSAEVYGREILTRRQELSLRWQGPRDGRWIWSAKGALVRHDQDSWYGTQEYDARQRLGLLVLSADRAWHEKHATVLEGGVRTERYDDNLELETPTDLSYMVPSLVLQHSWSPNRAWTVQAGNRAEYYEADGAVLTPRFTAAWSPLSMTTLRFSGGMGYRPVTLFSLDIATEAGFENVQLSENLKAEESRAVSAALSQRWVSPAASLRFDLNLFLTDFRSKAIIEHGEGSDIHISNASDADSRGFELQAAALHREGWSLDLGFARSRVRYLAGERWRDVELQYDYMADASFGRDLKARGLSAKLSATVYGPQHLPEGRGRSRSAAYAIWKAAVRKEWGPLNASLMINNLFDWTQAESPYIRDPETGRLRPDAALIYAPVLGRTITLGFGYSLGG